MCMCIGGFSSLARRQINLPHLPTQTPLNPPAAPAMSALRPPAPIPGHVAPRLQTRRHLHLHLRPGTRRRGRPRSRTHNHTHTYVLALFQGRGLSGRH